MKIVKIALIILCGSYFTTYSQDQNIIAGTEGDVNIESGGGTDAGDINIQTGSGYNSGDLFLNASGGYYGGSIFLQSGTASYNDYYGKIVFDSPGGYFFQKNDVDYCVLTKDGKFGIGTTDPQYDFHLIGEGKVTSHFEISGFSTTDMLDVRNDEPNLSSTTDLIWGAFGFDVSQPNNPRLLNLTCGSDYRFVVRNDGQVGIGIDPENSDYKLTVDGKILAEEISVELIAANKLTLDVDHFADFVFEDSYNLMSLTELRTYIKLHKHLPGVQSEKQLKKEGMDMVEMNRTLTRKIEELTLYILQLEERIENLEN